MKANLRFFTRIFGMKVLRHEEFEKPCAITCNGEFTTPWSKTMVGYGPEDDSFCSSASAIGALCGCLGFLMVSHHCDAFLFFVGHVSTYFVLGQKATHSTSVLAEPTWWSKDCPKCSLTITYASPAHSKRLFSIAEIDFFHESRSVTI